MPHYSPQYHDKPPHSPTNTLSRRSPIPQRTFKHTLSCALFAATLGLSLLPSPGECSPVIDQLIQTEMSRLLPCSDKATVAIVGSRASTFEAALRKATLPLTIVNRRVSGTDLCQADRSSASPFVMYFVDLNSTTVRPSETRLQIEIYRTDTGALVYQEVTTVAPKDVNSTLSGWVSRLSSIISNTPYKCSEQFNIEVKRNTVLTCRAPVTPRKEPPQSDNGSQQGADIPPSLPIEEGVVGTLNGIIHTLSANLAIYYTLEKVPLSNRTATPQQITGQIQASTGDLIVENILSGQRKHPGGCLEGYRNSEKSTIRLFSLPASANFTLRIPTSPRSSWTVTVPELERDTPVFRASSTNTLSPKTSSRSKECFQQTPSADALLLDETPISLPIPHFDLVGPKLPPTTTFSLCSRTPFGERGFQQIPNLTTQEGVDLTSRCSKNTATVTASIRRAF